MTWVLKGSHLCVQNNIYNKKHSTSNSCQMRCNDAILHISGSALQLKILANSLVWQNKNQPSNDLCCTWSGSKRKLILNSKKSVKRLWVFTKLTKWLFSWSPNNAYHSLSRCYKKYPICFQAKIIIMWASTVISRFA